LPSIVLATVNARCSHAALAWDRVSNSGRFARTLALLASRQAAPHRSGNRPASAESLARARNAGAGLRRSPVTAGASGAAMFALRRIDPRAQTGVR
jgi:hypothetical protein